MNSNLKERIITFLASRGFQEGPTVNINQIDMRAPGAIVWSRTADLILIQWFEGEYEDERERFTLSTKTLEGVEAAIDFVQHFDDKLKIFREKHGEKYGTRT